MNRSQFFDLLNYPWVHGPRLLRAHRVAVIRVRQQNQEHIAWAQRLAKTDVLQSATPLKEGE